MNPEPSSNKGKKSPQTTSTSAGNPGKPGRPETPKLPPLFRAIDWWAFALTALLVFVGYLYTLAPDVTLEDSGELAVGSFYAGVPHPPGYPVWTIYTWFFTKILPFSNIAWRVAVASAFAGAMGCGLIALVVSRGSSMMIEGISFLKGIERRLENAICIVSGFVAGMLMGFNGYMWSQSVIVEVYSLSVLSLMLVIAYLLRWLYEPDKRRYLYWAFFFFGICLTNHMSLLVAAMGIQIAIAAIQPKLGRDMFAGNALIYLVVLVMKAKGMVPTLDNGPVFAIFNFIGIGSVLACGWLAMKTEKLGTEWKPVVISGLAWVLGAAFYLYMPIASMSNPPMNWGYPRTAEGFVHAIKRGQYESIHPATDPFRFIGQLWMYVQGAIEEFNWVYLLIALVPFVFYRFMQKRERSWIIGLTGIFFFLSVLLLILLNPGLDKQSVELNRVFFTASHVIIAIGVGYGLTLIAASLVMKYDKARSWALIGGAVAAAFGLFTLVNIISESAAGEGGGGGFALFFRGLAQAFTQGDSTLKIYGGFALLVLTVIFLIAILIFRTRIFLPLVLAVFAFMPLHSIFSHWYDNEQRGHLFGYWFGHDMFTPPFTTQDGKPIYPEMARDAVVFGGTDPGRFNPTYMIFCESFIPAKDKPNDPNFDRRDCYLITQNALADGTYLSYIRAHYNRSAQVDPPFFQNFFKTRLLSPLDNVFTALGDRIEKQRRAGTSYFQEHDFKDIASLTAQLREKKDPVSKFLSEQLKPETQQAISGNDEKKTRDLLAKDFNRVLESGAIYNKERFQGVELSDHSRRFIAENPTNHTVIRWNRLLLEDAYPKAIAKSPGGVYPDLEIITPSPEDSQRCFNEYLADAERRFRNNQLKPGEDFKVDNGRVQVSGQVAVMSINGLLTKVIFDKNPGHEFYVEESFPLDWMFPHLTPFGIIMKINRQTVPEITEEMVKKDHEFWSKFSERLIGNWITYDTPVKEICAFAEKVYMRHDLRGYKGDPKFIRDDNAQKAFSKLRSSIGGVYSWRLGYMGFECPPEFRASKNPAELQRVIRETDFAFKQAFAFCPFSPEAVYRYVQFLTSQGRFDDAVEVARTCFKLDPLNEQIGNLVNQLENIKQAQGQPRAVAAQAIYADITKAIQQGKTNEALSMLDQIVASPNANPDSILFSARAYVQLGDTLRLERALQKLVTIAPDSAEAWYDLAGLQTMLQRPQAIDSLRKAIELSNARRKSDPNQRDLIAEALRDPRFGPLRQNPEFQKLTGQK